MTALWHRFLTWLFLGALGMLFVGCTIQLVTVPDPATTQWITDVDAFNAAVKKEVDQHEQRIRALEQKENDT